MAASKVPSGDAKPPGAEGNSQAPQPSAQQSPHQIANTLGEPIAGSYDRTQDDRAGRLVGKYQILRFIGKGGMGTVYEALDTSLNRHVAIKFVSDFSKASATTIERFTNEAQIASQLSHPNIIAVHDMGQDGDDGSFFIVMEMLSPESVGRYVKKHGALHWTEATKIALECANALNAAHPVGIVHRDVKPDNILCSRSGHVKLVDFGLVKQLRQGLASVSQSGMLHGTPLYMSPEQACGNPIDGRSDIYSLGITYYEMLTGKPPYAGDNLPQLLMMHATEPSPDPRLIVPEIPEACVKIFMRATQKQLSQRYQSAAEMAAELEAALVGAPKHEFTFLVKSSSGSWGSSRPLEGLAATPRSQARAANSHLTGATHSVMGVMQPSTTSPPRRRMLQLAVGGALATVVASGLVSLRFLFRAPQNPPGPPATPQPVPATPVVKAAPLPSLRVGILHSLSGTMALSERAVVDSTLLAIEEINARGGVLNRQIEPIVVDGKSDAATFEREAERLIDKEKVATIFGVWTSASRKAVKPVFEKYDHLLLYPVQYEGLEDSANIIYVGAAPNQQAIPAVRWALEKLKSKRFFLIGSDYVFPRAINAILRDVITEAKSQIVGEKYVLLGETNFGPLVKKLVAEKPDIIVNSINGDSNFAFFRALRAAGITSAEIPTISLSISENELSQFGSLNMVGDYLACNYFQSISRPANDTFIKHFKEKYGEHRVANDPMESAYSGVYMWAQAVKAANSDDPKAIRRVLKGMSFDAPGAQIRIDPSNNHTWKQFRMGRIAAGGKIEEVASSGKQIPPIPFPETRTRAEWEALLELLYRTWGSSWVNPQRPTLVKALR